MELSLGWTLMCLGAGVYIYRGVMTGPLRADAAGECERPFQLDFLFDAARLVAPMGVALTLAAWPEVDHDNLTSGMPVHLQLGILASALGFIAAMIVLRWRRWFRT